MEKYRQELLDSLSDMLSNVVQLLPQLVIGILGLIVAWVLLKIILFVLKRVLKAAKIDALSAKVTEAKLLGDKEVKINLLKITLTTVKILLILFFTIVIAEVIGLNAISEGIISILGYLPTLVSALLIFAGGFYLATVVKKAVLALFNSMGINGSKIISSILFYMITFFVSITALNQAGIDTDIITSNFTMILGAFLFAIALGFGLGSREVFADVLKMFYTRKNYMVGDQISIGDLEGTIEAIDNITMTLKTKKGKVIIPIDEVVSNRVLIK
ncbi:mechanosensitive ion channel family protein [Croceitalea rosinachiae]|uniref:Mechanosensitive ion channel n=1 Tax=Croceitalea rosinachiae TaxID=3075596 RepID=A0ABU3AGB6_9FLAO|nr:mechanosensitive ion channel domain-containing protein [Croceitalea sp. F388]MDT0608597.1 mechanosensitive ion channel [Croceitalea sp. F388]